MTEYSRDNPSPRFLELIALYKEMHEHGAQAQNISPEKTFDGRSLQNHAGNIQQINMVLGAKTVLDYGSGKGSAYRADTIALPDGSTVNGMKEFWGVNSITCYDPGYEPFSQLPSGTFDAVVSTDVLEHCPKEDIPWLIDEIFGYAENFVYLNVACYPAMKTLPNGENAHCTVEPPEWWIALFDARIQRTPHLRYFAAFDVPTSGVRDNIVTVMHRGRWQRP